MRMNGLIPWHFSIQKQTEVKTEEMKSAKNGEKEQFAKENQQIRKSKPLQIIQFVEK